MDKLNMSTPDLTARRIDQIAALFPSAITEARDADGGIRRAVNFEALRQLLSPDVVDGGECYAFTWVGKKAAAAEAARPITKTLRPAPEESRDWDSTENLYIEGDNLEALKILQESYLGKVKMIYIDPPYNTGHDFIYRDNFTMDAEKYRAETGQTDEAGNRLFRNAARSGRYHSEWCSMMYSRLILARNLLADDGVLCASIDDNEFENMRKICAELFGEQNMVAIFIWNCSTAGGIRPKFASKTHEYVVCYAKNKEALPTLFAPLSESAKRMYTQSDARGPYRNKDFVFKNKSANANQKYLIECPDGEKVKPKDGYIYRFVRERFDQALSEGLVTFNRTDTGPLVDEDGKQAHWNIYIKKYLGDAMGAPSTLIPKEMASMYNVGTQCVQSLFGNTRVFENAKPVDVISYFLHMMVSPNDLVLDFFSGSATTAHAVMQRNAEDGGRRKFILMQIPEPCAETSEAFRAGYKNICEIGKERIRRAGDQIKAERPAAAGSLDCGFRVFRVDESNMEDIWYHPEELTQQMLGSVISNIKPGRTGLDLLYACLLDWGVEIHLPHNRQTVDGCTIHTVGNGALAACFDEKIPASVIQAMAEAQPLRAVFRDASFASDADKINVTETFHNLSPDTIVKVI